MAHRFDGKVALVTGGSTGIGRATALKFAAEGASVVIADINVSQGQLIAEQINQNNGKSIFVPTDVSSPTQVSNLIDKTVETYGKLDFAFNNAGIEGVMASTVDCTEENWDRTIDINLKGVWLCMKYEIPTMLKQGGGVIVNMASVAGLVGFAGLPAYAASKGGVIQLTKTAALEFSKSGIRINAVCPGAIQTSMIERIESADEGIKDVLTNAHPIGRIGKPEEVADVVIWLCSEQSSFVVGYPIAIDGGYLAQ
jgi:NAD(P)-dependent dehydrogenase (short-subunit alcohol dehydrogenase family)